MKEKHAVNSPMAGIHGTLWWVSADWPILRPMIILGDRPWKSWSEHPYRDQACILILSENVKSQRLSVWLGLIWFNRIRGAQKQPACHQRLPSFKMTVNHFLTVQASCFHTVRGVRKHFLTCPAMNWPKPGGNVRVETSRVTRAGYTRRLTGRDGLWGH